MNDQLVQFLHDINISQLISIGAMFWFFYNRLSNKIDVVTIRLDNKIDSVHNRLETKIDDVKSYLEGKSDKLGDKIEDIDRRLCRIEGSLATQGHCLVNQKHDHKAL